MKLIKLWDSDLGRAYELLSSLPKEENGFENEAFGLQPDEFRSYVERKKANSEGLRLHEGFVADTVYLLEADGRYVGLFKLRHRLNDFLRSGPGHIGFGIAPAYRGRGYGAEGLRLALEEARSIVPEDEIYLSLHADNPASLKVQLKNGAHIHHRTDSEIFTRIKLR